MKNKFTGCDSGWGRTPQKGKSNNPDNNQRQDKTVKHTGMATKKHWREGVGKKIKYGRGLSWEILCRAKNTWKRVRKLGNSQKGCFEPGDKKTRERVI